MKVLISAPLINASQKSLDLSKNWIIHTRGLDVHGELIDLAKSYDAIITLLSDKIDQDFIDRNLHLKIIQNYAVGINNIDTEYAAKKNIKVGNTPDVLTDATAELALILLLNLTRNIIPALNNVKNSQWNGWEPKGFLGPSLNNKTIGIIGAGRIGKKMIQLCQSLGMDAIYHNRSQISIKDAEQVDLSSLLSRSDVVSLHCPLTAETNNMVDEEFLKKMKSNSYLINTGRGELINHEDLFRALKSNHLAGAGLDVTNPEPINMNSPLLHLDNCLITPHIGSATVEARTEMLDICFKNIEDCQ